MQSNRVSRDGQVVSILTDITPLKMREREIKEKSNQLNGILNNMPQGVAVFDAGFHLITRNNHTRALFAIPDDPAQPRMPYEDLLRHLLCSGCFNAARQGEGFLYNRGTPIESHVDERALADGTVIEVRRHDMPDGGTIATFTNITERKRVETELREAKEAAERTNRA